MSFSSLNFYFKVASSEPAIVISNINVLVEHGLGERGEKNFRLVHDTCATVLKISTATKTSSTDNDPPFKFPHDHEIFIRLEKLFIEGIMRLQDDQVIYIVYFNTVCIHL